MSDEIVFSGRVERHKALTKIVKAHYNNCKCTNIDSLEIKMKDCFIKKCTINSVRYEFFIKKNYRGTVIAR